MPANITLTPEQYEATRQRMIQHVTAAKEVYLKNVREKRLELDLAQSAELVYKQHGKNPPWSNGVVGGPEDITKQLHYLQTQLAERDAELALLESLSALPARKLLLRKGTPMTKDESGNWFRAGAGYVVYGWLQEDVYEDERSYQHKVGPARPPAEPVRIKSPVTDPAAEGFFYAGKDTGKKLP